MNDLLKFPAVYFGGKRAVADIIWSRLGNVTNYVEVFGGSLAVLLSRPPEHFECGTQRIETVNDINAFLENFWRACRDQPALTAFWADRPTSELALHATGDAMFYRGMAGHDGSFRSPKEFIEKLRGDETWFDPKLAGLWVWGLSNWIGDDWSAKKENEVVLSLPHLGSAGQGVARQLPHLGSAGRGVARQLPHLGNAGQGECARHLAALTEWFIALADRLRHVRICCGDWKRVVKDSVIFYPGTPTGILLDPPYVLEGRDSVYGEHESATIAAEVRAWALANGNRPELRIALCSYGEEELPGWERVRWSAQGGYGNQGDNSRCAENRHRESIDFSPHCLKAIEEPSLFAESAK